MANFYANYPVSGAAGGSNPSVGINTATAPASSTEVGFVDGSGNLQPFSGTSAASGPNVAVSSSALPTGAATAALQTTQETTLTTIQANQTNGTQHTIVDSSALPSGASTSALQTTGNTALTTINTTLTNGTQHTIVDSSALPSGGSTSALQTTGNTSLASIDTKTPALGQALAAASVPVVLTAAQLTALTPITSSPINTNGSASNITNLTTSVQSFTPPTNAIGFIFESESSNTNNIRWAVGTTATSTVGTLMEPGRDTGFIPVKATVSFIALAGTNQAVSIQWILSS